MRTPARVLSTAASVRISAVDRGGFGRVTAGSSVGRGVARSTGDRSTLSHEGHRRADDATGRPQRGHLEAIDLR
ncbi:hypothetical protein Voc01_024280 [Virgisporangium ochraceum]|uniref:Uncharacterized protein n=1 Tax=Virgisporangium ochraceum TaxID=65505 RepID=A0A8J4EAA0_9ACTN|nr:hypothetical protein Voc01_024280 [Virgisporangium ochraceum]